MLWAQATPEEKAAAKTALAKYSAHVSQSDRYEFPWSPAVTPASLF